MDICGLDSCGWQLSLLLSQLSGASCISSSYCYLSLDVIECITCNCNFDWWNFYRCADWSKGIYFKFCHNSINNGNQKDKLIKRDYNTKPCRTVSPSCWWDWWTWGWRWGSTSRPQPRRGRQWWPTDEPCGPHICKVIPEKVTNTWSCPTGILLSEPHRLMGSWLQTRKEYSETNCPGMKFSIIVSLFTC